MSPFKQSAERYVKEIEEAKAYINRGDISDTRRKNLEDLISYLEIMKAFSDDLSFKFVENSNGAISLEKAVAEVDVLGSKGLIT